VPKRLEKRAFKTLKNRFASDVGIRIVNENARLHVALGIYMEIVSAACDTAADIFAVILEIHYEHRLAGFAVSDLFQPVGIIVFILTDAEHPVADGIGIIAIRKALAIECGGEGVYHFLCYHLGITL
jgi:hypothetical protein